MSSRQNPIKKLADLTPFKPEEVDRGGQKLARGHGQERQVGTAGESHGLSSPQTQAFSIITMTPRINLQPISQAHAAFLYAANQGNVKHYFVDFPTPATTVDWIRQAEQAVAAGQKYEYVAFSGTGPVGAIGINMDGDRPEIGLWVDPAQQGNGYGSAMVRAVLDLNATQLHFSTLYYVADRDNESSNRIARSCGFEQYDTTDSEIFYRYRV